jgi:hypothetical protein
VQPSHDRGATWHSIALAASVISALCANPASADTQPEAVEPDVLALAREIADERANRFWRLYDEILSQPLSHQWISEDKWLVGSIRDYLIEANPGREDDVYEFINGGLRPLLLQTRDEFVCLTTRRAYRMEMSFVEKEGPTDDKRKERLQFLRSNRKTVVFQAHRFQLRSDLYHFIWLSWDALRKEGFRLYVIREGDFGPDLTRELDYSTLDYLEQRWFDSRSNCGAPWAI